MKERLHTADHILFGVLNSKYKADSLGMKIDEEQCSVSYKSETDLRPLKDGLELEVNRIIQEGHDVVSYSLPREKAKDVVDVSLVPEEIKDITIYEIVGFNKLACAGPHVANTREIGKFRITKIEKKRKDTFSVKYVVE